MTARKPTDPTPQPSPVPALEREAVLAVQAYLRDPANRLEQGLDSRIAGAAVAASDTEAGARLFAGAVIGYLLARNYELLKLDKPQEPPKLVTTRDEPPPSDLKTPSRN